MYTFFITICLIITLILYILKSVAKPRNFPPGPDWYPFVGSRIIVQREIKNHGSQWKAMSHLAKKYSTDILGLKLTNEVVIFVRGLDNIKEVSNRKDFDGRPDGFFIRQRTYGKRIGITFTDGPVWKLQRHFLMKYLRDMGMGRLQCEKEIIVQLENIINYINVNGNKPLNIRSLTSMSIVNVLWKYIAGENVKKEKLHKFVKMLTERSKVFKMAGGLLNEFPWLRFLIPERSGYNLLVGLCNCAVDIVEDSIEKHLKKQIPGHDFIYDYLNEMNKNIEDKKDIFTYDQLKGICIDLLIASAQTSSSVLHFAFIILIHHQDIQEKVYQDINKTLGDRTPSWADYTRLVYTSAFLQEILRYYTIAPISGPRRALCDSMLGGYFIPKGATVIVSLGNLHSDPEQWSDPEVFNPERFIKGDKLIYSEYLNPFGTGRRRCPGSTLAKQFLFIVLAGILQKFKIISDDVLPPLEPVEGLLLEPKSFKARFIRR